MKRLIFIGTLLLSSCATKEMTKHRESCIVESVNSVNRYGGLMNETWYVIKTDCGYSLSSTRKVFVGDTIDVDVYTYPKN